MWETDKTIKLGAGRLIFAPAVSEKEFNMKIIGLTGGIASGKSLVAGMLTRLGAEVIDADEVGHQVIEPGLPAYYEIINTFGAAILDSNGKVNRKRLGEVVFSCPDKLQKLNHITHPRIFSKIHDLIELTKTTAPSYSSYGRHCF